MKGKDAASGPVVLEIVKNAYTTIAQEMGITLVRSAFSTRVKERSDATAAIFDAAGQSIAQSPTAPLSHLASLRPSLAELLKDFPARSIHDGDLFAMNDPYRGGIHANDIMVYRPVFIGGRLRFFTAALVHVADVGGMAAGGLPATATEVYHEGLLLPPLKIAEAGRLDRGIERIIQANSRTPSKVMGDIRAMIAAANVGARRLAELVQRYGDERLAEITGALLDYSERRTRQEIKRLPRGVYRGEFAIDDDGIDSSREYRVRVAIGVKGPDLALDFTGTDPQARGAINASYSQATSGALFAIRAFLDPSIPMNEGCYRPVRLILPEGSLVNPRPPAACNARIVTNMAVAEAVAQALSKAWPDRAVAASSVNHVSTMSGAAPHSEGPWLFLENDFGGSGARRELDGCDGVGSMVLAGSGGATPIEALEQEYPVLFERYALWRDSGGPGRRRGGLGLERTVRVLEPARVTVRTDRSRIPPPGADGGLPGKGGRWVINRDTPRERMLPSKATGMLLNAGETMTMLSSGGGGFGPPDERDPELVLADVLEGKVSLKAAREIYRVVISPSLWRVNTPATKVLRRQSQGRA